MKMAAAAIRLAEESGLLDKHVFFNPGWVEYEKRADYLLEADIGVSTHFEHVETAFSFRTRILDYLWAGLPILATEGDSLSRLVTQHDLGLTVPAEDVGACASAIRRLHNDEDFYKACQANVEALAPGMTWEKALAPVLEFCRLPRAAPDRVGQAHEYVSSENLRIRRGPTYLAKRFYDYYKAAGPQTAMLHARNFVRQRLSG
jgi:glycosyltransferase involved in cell wall biosynthesis